jgi:long-chain fatty acid transport protein
LRFKNSWRAGIGANYQLNNEWKLRFGYAYDKTPVQDQFRSPRLPDESRNWLAIGAQWAFSKQGALDFGYAHEFVDDASSNLAIPAAAPLPGGTLRGTYKADVNILGIQVRYSF